MLESGVLTNLMTQGNRQYQAEIGMFLLWIAGGIQEPSKALKIFYSREPLTERIRIGGEYFAYYTTASSKSRENFLRILLQGKEGYAINEAFIWHLFQCGVEIELNTSPD